MNLPQVSVDNALMKAKSFTRKGDIELARKTYESILFAYPKNIRAQKALQSLNLPVNKTKNKAIPQEKINKLVNLYDQGRFAELVEKTNQIIEVYPDTYIIWNINGAAYKALGKSNEALTSFRKVVSLNPNFPEGHNNLGTVLKDLGHYDDAIQAYKKALFLEPNYAEANYNIGIALQDQGKYNDAIIRYKKALSLNPNYANAYNNLGTIYLAQDNKEDAIKSYEKALAISPNSIEALCNIGTIFKDKGQNKEALDFYKKALSINPNCIDTLFNKAIVLVNEGHIKDAIKSYKRAILIKPDFYQAFNNIGIIKSGLGLHDEALEMYQKAIKFNPNYAEPYNNIGIIKANQGLHSEALEMFKKSLLINPNYTDAYNNIANTLETKGKRKEAIDYYNKVLLINPNYEIARSKKLHQLAHIIDWEGIKNDSIFLLQLGMNRQSVIPFGLISLEDIPEKHKKRSEIFSKDKFLQKPLQFNFKIKEEKQPIRIGYFSSDFNEHPVSQLLAGVWDTHDRHNFKVYGYSINGTMEDDLRKRVIKSFDVFKDVSKLNDKEVALLARSDEIDIAIDLNGYTQNSRTGIFGYRAAPVQINFLGYPGTLGTEFIDYIIADHNLIPKESQKFYSEKPIYLPNTYMPTDNTREISTRHMTRREMGLPENDFVFCCFNNNYKITSEEFDIWMRLLGKVQNSVLWLRKSNEWSEDNFRKEAIKRSVDPRRLIFANRIPIKEHLARHRLADLFLDTFNFNAHTTASEALWAGLPVVTKMGKGFAARVAGSLLRAIDCPELIAETNEDYESLILDLAINPKKLSKIREKLGKNRLSKPLFNTELYTKNIEKAFKKAYQIYVDDKKPEIINIK